MLLLFAMLAGPLHLLYLEAYPCPLADEVRTFVYNQTGSVYSRQQVNTKMTELSITNKWASFESRIIFKCRPLGVNVFTIDEFGIALQKT